MRDLLLWLMASTLQAQTPTLFELLPRAAQVEATDLVHRADVGFQTRTQPKQVQLAAMGKRFDHPILGAVSSSFWGNTKGHQDEFIAGINGKVATFGEIADLNPGNFHLVLKRDGDSQALRDFEARFMGK